MCDFIFLTEERKTSKIIKISFRSSKSVDKAIEV